jgi:hypothetical protein
MIKASLTALALMPFLARSCGLLRSPAPRSRDSSAHARATPGRGRTAEKVPN